MKLLIISNLYKPNARGGAEMIASNIAEEALRQGNDVSVLSTSVNESSHDREDVDGVGVYRYEPQLPYYLLDDAEQSLKSRLLWHAKDLVGSLVTRNFVRTVIKETAPDIILTFNLRGMEISSITREVRRSRTLWYHELHDIQLLVPSGLRWFGSASRKNLRWLWQNPIVTFPYKKIMTYIMGSPDRIIGPSQFIIDAHRRAGMFGKSEAQMLINPVDLAIEVGDRRANAVTRLLFVGQLEEHKGVKYLIDALGRVDTHKICLDIVGDGSEEASLMKSAINTPDNVDINMYGRVDHEKVFKMMKKADALVLPSVVVENCPGVVLEARAVGLPVIASDVGGLPELIDVDGLFAPADAIGIAQKIHEVAEGKIKDVGREGLLDVEEYVTRLLRS